MFQLARTSAKAVLVAAGAAGFVALGAGIASADALGVPGAVQPQSVAPSVPGLPAELTGAEDQVQRDAAGVPDTLRTVRQAADLDTVHQSAAPQEHGLAHRAVTTLPAQTLPADGDGAVHSTLNGAMNGAEQVNRLSNELPESEVPASVTETETETLPQSAEVPEETGGLLPESPEDVTNRAPEVGTDAVTGKVGSLAEQAPVDASDVPDVAEPTDEVTGAVEDADSVGELQEAETPVL